MLFHLNHQGLNSSYDYLSELCYNVTETCLSAENEILLNILSHSFFRRNRSVSKHGGLTVYVRSGFKAKVRENLWQYVDMMCETLVLEVGTQTQDNFFEVIVHKLPPSKVCSFMGDFNIGLMQTNDKTCQSSCDLMNSFIYVLNMFARE